MSSLTVSSREKRATGIALIDQSSGASLGRIIRMLPLIWSLVACPFLLTGTLAMTPVVAWGSLAVLPFFYIARRRFDALGLMAALAFFLAVYVPAFSLAYIGDLRSVTIALIALPWLALLEYGVRKIASVSPVTAGEASRFDAMAIAVFLALAVAWGAFAEDPTNAGAPFLILYAFSLCHLERLAQGAKYRSVALILFGLAITFYTLVIWDTYGRLLLGALAVAPALIIMMHLQWRPGPKLLLLVLPPLIALNQWVRADEFSSTGIRDSSMASPNLLAVGLLERMDLLAVRWSSFVEQFSFFYFSWVPRAAWPDKPVGLGLTIVDELTGRKGVSDTHSLAPGIVGEALWLFGPYLIAGLLISVFLYWSVSVVIRLLTRNSTAALAVHFALIPTLLWGGTASYSARAWALIIPIIAYYWLLYFITARKGAAR